MVLCHLDKNNLLSDFQYGFRSCRSTADVLTVITHRISEALDRGFESRAIALDISKAFDKVWHAGLLLKLSSYGISGKVFATIKSFLCNRSFKVVINGECSESIGINAGVPPSFSSWSYSILDLHQLPKYSLKSL